MQKQEVESLKEKLKEIQESQQKEMKVGVEIDQNFHNVRNRFKALGFDAKRQKIPGLNPFTPKETSSKGTLPFINKNNNIIRKNNSFSQEPKEAIIREISSLKVFF